MLLIILSAYLLIQLPLSVVHSNDVAPPAGFEFVGNLLKNAMNHAVDPCEDFYTYACGGYNDANQQTTRQQHLTAKINDQLIDLLKTVTSQENMPADLLQLLKKLFSQCTQMHDLPPSAWAKEVHEVIDRLGGMPLFTKKTYGCKPVEFARFLAKSHKNNVFYYSPDGIAAPTFFTPSIVEISKFHPKNIMKLSMQFEEKYSKHSLDTKKRAFMILMKKYSQAIGAVFNKDERVLDINLIAELEDNLGKFQPSEEVVTESDVTYNELKKIITFIDLDTYFSELLPEQIAMEFTKHKNPMIRVILNFFKNVEIQFRNNSYTCDVKYNYVYLKLIYGSFLLYSDITGNYVQHTCIQALSDSPLKVGLSALYLQSHKQDRDILADLEKGMGKWIHIAIKNNLLKRADWIANEETQNNVLKKLRRMGMKTDGSALFYDKKKLATYHSGILFNGNKNYFQNRRAIGQWSINAMMQRLLNPLCVYDYWYTHYALTPNAFYDPRQNEIIINPGYSQEPFYSKGYPNFYNYGAFGNIIGHEITHGFDNNGRWFDEGGAFKNEWDQETEKKYRIKAGVCVRQYSKVNVTEVNMMINGGKTMDENIADNGGIKAAFIAYKGWENKQQKNGKNKEQGLAFIPGMEDISTDKLVFISAAQPLCGPRKGERLRKLLTSGRHSPDKYRVNIPFKNYEVFTDVFKCHEGQKMYYDKNNRDICNIW